MEYLPHELKRLIGDRATLRRWYWPGARAAGSLWWEFWGQKRRFKARKHLFLEYFFWYINIIAWLDPDSASEGRRSWPEYFSFILHRHHEAFRVGNHPYHRLSPVHATIPAKHGGPDAKKPNPVSRLTLTVDRKKKMRKRGLRSLPTTPFPFCPTSV